MLQHLPKILRAASRKRIPIEISSEKIKDLSKEQFSLIASLSEMTADELHAHIENGMSESPQLSVNKIPYGTFEVTVGGESVFNADTALNIGTAGIYGVLQKMVRFKQNPTWGVAKIAGKGAESYAGYYTGAALLTGIGCAIKCASDDDEETDSYTKGKETYEDCISKFGAFKSQFQEMARVQRDEEFTSRVDCDEDSPAFESFRFC
jgi:hypothetical protein